MAKNTKTAPKNTEKQANKKKTEKANQESPSPYASKGQAIRAVSAAQLAKERAGQGQKPTKEHGRSSDDPEDDVSEGTSHKVVLKSNLGSKKGREMRTKVRHLLGFNTDTDTVPKVI